MKSAVKNILWLAATAVILSISAPAAQPSLADEAAEILRKKAGKFSDEDANDLAKYISLHRSGREGTIAEIKQLREEIRALVIAVARRQEQSGQVSLTVDKNGLRLSDAQANRLQEIEAAKEKANISLRSFRVAVELLISANQSLLREIAATSDPNIKRRLALTQCIVVSEIASAIVYMIDNVQGDGGGLQAIYAAEMKAIEAQEAHLRSFESNGEATDSERRFGAGIRSALAQTRAGWDSVMETIEKQQSWIADARSVRQKYVRLREAAGIQLGVLERIYVLVDVMNSIEDIETLLDREVPLLELNNEMINQLLGVGTLERVAAGAKRPKR